MPQPFLKNMENKAIIQSRAIIRNGRASKDNVLVAENLLNPEIETFASEIYKSLGLTYSKFFKMDNLSKLAFLSAEILFKGEELKDREKTGIFIANSSSSLDTDRKYAATMSDSGNYFPSPSLFVYTLPNIMMGELSIRHKITGENAFFIFQEFEFAFVCDYVNLLFELNKIRSCMVGWVDVNGLDYESFLFHISLSPANSIQEKFFTSENLKQEYEYGRNN